MSVSHEDDDTVSTEPIETGLASTRFSTLFEQIKEQLEKAIEDGEASEDEILDLFYELDDYVTTKLDILDGGSSDEEEEEEEDEDNEDNGEEE